MTDYLDFKGLCRIFYGDAVVVEDDWDRDYEPDPDHYVKAAKEDAFLEELGEDD
mgnify:CR=1 FL=1|jgi:beta-phosphoglucomutase-like phosphatase (HAD superfamily)|tara:strand:- start:85 stop:246 length:162 start_codon:yes stop_codon:yes gene_type:complete